MLCSLDPVARDCAGPAHSLLGRDRPAGQAVFT